MDLMLFVLLVLGIAAMIVWLTDQSGSTSPVIYVHVPERRSEGGCLFLIMLIIAVMLLVLVALQLSPP